jgi:hypothetical protein
VERLGLLPELCIPETGMNPRRAQASCSLTKRSHSGVCDACLHGLTRPTRGTVSMLPQAINIEARSCEPWQILETGDVVGTDTSGRVVITLAVDAGRSIS